MQKTTIKHRKTHRQQKRLKIKPSDDPYSVTIDTTPKQKVRFCLFRGCNKLVGTGEAVCDEHRIWFKNQQETVGWCEDCECHF